MWGRWFVFFSSWLSRSRGTTFGPWILGDTDTMIIQEFGVLNGVTVFTIWEGCLYLWTKGQTVIDSIIQNYSHSLLLSLPFDLRHSYLTSLSSVMLPKVTGAEDENGLAHWAFLLALLPSPWEDASVGDLLCLQPGPWVKNKWNRPQPNQQWGTSILLKISQSVCFMFMGALIILSLMSHSLFGKEVQQWGQDTESTGSSLSKKRPPDKNVNSLLQTWWRD